SEGAAAIAKIVPGAMSEIGDRTPPACPVRRPAGHIGTTYLPTGDFPHGEFGVALMWQIGWQEFRRATGIGTRAARAPG
ncbi:MAG: hypothetical protein M1541_18135, partial [Acidobacteria bacterium]|nr:hypothetical protein [Acidobacteriota bacterium]